MLVDVDVSLSLMLIDGDGSVKVIFGWLQIGDVKYTLLVLL